VPTTIENQRCRMTSCLHHCTPHIVVESGHITKSSIQQRRQLFKSALHSIILSSSALISLPKKGSAVEESEKHQQSYDNNLLEINDPDTYSALVHLPPSLLSSSSSSTATKKKYPVIIVLHGAGKNELDIWNLANIKGEHAGLIPSLIYSGNSPKTLYENFIVVAPYSYGKASFYEEPRSKVLQFINWFCSSNNNKQKNNVVNVENIDLNRLFLFGFSDGATLGVELMTTRKFAGGVFAAYGFTGKLPALALERLRGIPMWIFHSADDVIFPVNCSDRLVRDLRVTNTGSSTNGVKSNEVVRYTRYDQDQEGFTGSVRGHSTGISASKNEEVYNWLLSI